MAERRSAVAVLEGPEPEATTTRTRPTLAATTTAPATAARVAFPTIPDVAETTAATLGPGVPVPTSGASAGAGRTKLRLGLLAVPVVPAALPLVPLVPTSITQGAAVRELGTQVTTVQEEVASCRAALDAATGPALGSRLRPKAVPRDVELPLAEVVLPGPVGRATVLLLLAALTTAKDYNLRDIPLLCNCILTRTNRICG